MSYLNALTSQVYWSPPDKERDRPILGAIVGRRATLIADTGASPSHAAQFLTALSEIGGAPPGFAALTHWHWDHVFGTGTMALPTLAHGETRRRVLEMARLDWRDHALDARVAAGLEHPMIAHHMKIELTNAQRGVLAIVPPDITFTDQVVIDLGGITVQVCHVGGDHSPDSSIIYAVEEKVAFLGDCLSSGFDFGPAYYTLGKLLPLLDRLESLPADFYIHAHSPVPQPRAEFLRESGQIRRIADLVGRFPERDAALARLPAALGEPPNEDHVEILDDLLTGMQAEG